MSASQEKKRRQEERAAGTDKVSIQHKEKENKRKKNTRIISIVVAVVLLFVIGAVFINSDYAAGNLTAGSAGNVNFTLADFNYYYWEAYYNYKTYVQTNYSDYASSMLPSTATAFDKQTYDQSTGQTWADFFKSSALKDMQSLAMLYSESKKANFTLSADDKTKMDSEVKSEQDYATASKFTKFDDFLAKNFGKGVTEAVYKKNLEMQYIANAYSAQVKSSYTYSESDLASYYDTNKDKYDIITYRYFLVKSADVVKTDYPTDDAYNEAAKIAKDNAKTKADYYLSQVTDEKSFSAQATAYDATTYPDEKATLQSYKGSILGEYKTWLLDAGRKYGDKTVLETSSGYYVMYFISRDNNQYKTANVRQVLIKPDSVDQSQYANDTAGYDKAVADAKQAAKDKADKIYQEWKDAGGTEDAFAAIATKYTDDTGSKTTGGLYKNVYKNQMIEVFNDWCFNSTHQKGDNGIIYSDAYGYHILYFSGYDMLYSLFQADTDKRTADYTNWETDKLKGYDTKTNWLYSLMG